jgi:hypothetical protein
LEKQVGVLFLLIVPKTETSLFFLRLTSASILTVTLEKSNVTDKNSLQAHAVLQSEPINTFCKIQTKKWTSLVT